MANSFSTNRAESPRRREQSSRLVRPSTGGVGPSRPRQVIRMGRPIYLNVRHGSISMSMDEYGHLCISFVYDNILRTGRFTILFFAREGRNVTFQTVYPEAPMMTSTFPSEIGLGHTFRQSLATGLALREVGAGELTAANNNVFPLVIGAEANGVALYILAVLQPEGDHNAYNVVETARIVRSQDGSRHETLPLFEDDDPGVICSVCLDNPPDATFSCRHMMCYDCARRIPLRRCPQCRQPLEGFVCFIRRDENQAED